jgi:hypothetical protein
VHTDQLKLEEKDGIYPFAELVSASALTHEILTVCSARPTGSEHGQLKLTRETGGWRVQGTHAAQTINLGLATAGAGAPVVTV